MKLAAILSRAAILLLAAAPARAQELAMDAGTLAHALDRLANTGRVLYVAAHPDDENTRLLAYLANSRHVTAAYLSMTRGGGGQNLIGTEQDELLDVIRTEELLAARRLDGARQFFTRMRDFGFSKTADETLAVWNRDEALADVVWVIRRFRPDVVILRFDERPPNHGHHTASAILGREAFAAAADPNRFPEQLARGVEPWQAERLLLNVPTWREEPPPPDALSLDVSGYDPRLGTSYGDLAAASRSQHKSQGFGVAGERGPIIERFLSLAGTRPEKDVLEGIDLGWTRFGERAAPLAKALEKARAALSRDRPEAALPALLDAHLALDALPDDVRVRDARAALADVIAAASGLFVRATAAKPSAVPGGSVPVSVEIVLRRPSAMTLESIEFPGIAPVAVDAPLAPQDKKLVSRDVPIAADAPVSAPYWLAAPMLAGRQAVADARLVGDPKGPPALAVAIDVAVGGRAIRLETPVVFAWPDRVHGERVRSFIVVPPATITPARHAVMFPNGKAAAVALRVHAGKDDLRGNVSLGLPAAWRSQPPSIPVALARAGDETTVRFDVVPPAGAGPISVSPAIEVDGIVQPRGASANWSYREDVIDYAHVPMQIVLQPAKLVLAPVALALPKGPVGYVEGSGDTIAADLAHVGMAVEMLDDETLRSGNLARHPAIVVGIRAYNTRPAVVAAHERLMRYVADGGTVVVQYNTTNPREPLTAPIGPFPLTVGRDRVTDENAAMTAVDPEDVVLRRPNRIAESDFAGWVQERGLYYAESWDERYRPIFSANDPGEKALGGGLLVADHGRGRYVYTGLAFFRQLPAGVPGAYRLFANLIAKR